MPAYCVSPSARCFLSGHRIWALPASALATALLLAMGGAEAGEVSGTVTLNGKAVEEETLTVKKKDARGAGMTVRTDKNGRYRVFLAPGRYKVMLNSKSNCVTLHSLRVSIRQDLKCEKIRE